VTLGKKIGQRKVKTCWFGSAKWFWPKSKHAGLAQQNGFGPALFAEDAKVGTRHSTTSHLLLIG